MKSVALHLQKGGVGKTTISGTLASFFSMKGKTCLIDADPQGNSTSWFLGNTEYVNNELADLLYGRISVSETLCEIKDNLFLIPTFGIDGDLKLYGENQLSNEPFIFDDLKEELNLLDFDYIIYDLSPGMSKLERSVLISIDEVITPITPEFFSLDGISIFSNELNKLQKNMRRTIKHEKVIINAVNRSIDQHNRIIESIPTNLFKLYTIPVEPAFRKAQSLSKSILELSRQEKPKKETIDVLTKIMEDII